MRTHSARIDDCSASNQQYPFGRRPRTGRLDRELVPTCAFELYILRSAAPGPTECISAATASAIWSNIDRLGPVQNPAYRTSRARSSCSSGPLTCCTQSHTAWFARFALLRDARLRNADKSTKQTPTDEHSAPIVRKPSLSASY